MDIRINVPDGRPDNARGVHQRLARQGLPITGVSTEPGRVIVHFEDGTPAETIARARAVVTAPAPHVRVARPMAVDLRAKISRPKEIKPLW